VVVSIVTGKRGVSVLPDDVEISQGSRRWRVASDVAAGSSVVRRVHVAATTYVHAGVFH
jgi:hypothetical protein